MEESSQASLNDRERIISRLQEIIGLLAQAEKAGGKHSFTTAKPKRNDEINDKCKQLDVLARLLVNEQGNETDRDICVAVFQKQNKELLIASNRKEGPKGLEKVFSSLSMFANFPNEENYLPLVEIVMRNTFAFISRSSSYHRRESTGNLRQTMVMGTLKDFLKSVNDENNWSDQKAKRKFLGLAYEASEELKNKTDSPEWDYLLFLDDLNIISNVILEEEMNEELFCAIKKERVIPVKDGEKGLHAEMKIIDKLLSSNLIMELESGEKYIGISKLTCVPCQITIDLINEQFDVKVCGTHGSCYKGWLPPKVVTNDKLLLIEEKLKELRAKKFWESTSEIKARGLTKAPQFTEQAEAQILQPISNFPGTSKK